MFGIKIISEERYRSEQNSAKKMVELHDELVKKNVRLELDIKDLREQNSKLRALNGKRKDENDNLVEKNRKLKEQLKEKQEVKFDKYFTLCASGQCDTCPHEQEDCNKFYLEHKTDVVCICPKPSFRTKK